MRKFGNILAWILAIFLAIVFTYAGGIKLIGARPMVQEFAQIGIGQWFRYLTGILEVSGAIGLLVPKYRFWAALQIAAVMACATAVNIAILHAPPLARLTAMLMTLALATCLAAARLRNSSVLPTPEFRGAGRKQQRGLG